MGNLSRKNRNTDEEPLLDSAYQTSRRKATSAFYGVTESHQYELDESEVWRHHQLQRYRIS
jgi:hypothetical protein